MIIDEINEQQDFVYEFLNEEENNNNSKNKLCKLSKIQFFVLIKYI